MLLRTFTIGVIKCISHNISVTNSIYSKLLFNNSIKFIITNDIQLMSTKTAATKRKRKQTINTEESESKLDNNNNNDIDSNSSMVDDNPVKSSKKKNKKVKNSFNRTAQSDDKNNNNTDNNAEGTKKTKKSASNPMMVAKLCDDGKKRCWGYQNPDSCNYHDTHWGRATVAHPSNTLDRNSVEYKTSLRNAFASLTYQIMQSGISWKIVFKKIANFEAAFDNFDLQKVANYNEKKIQSLLIDAGIIRNELKIRAVVNNAKLVLKAEEEYLGGFYGLVFHDIDNGTYPDKERILPKGSLEGSYMRSDFKTKSTDRLETDGVHPSLHVYYLHKRLKNYGFKFVGETVVLSWMQAIGLANHHAKECFAFAECEEAFKHIVNLRKKYSNNNNNNNAVDNSNNSNNSKVSKSKSKAQK